MRLLGFQSPVFRMGQAWLYRLCYTITVEKNSEQESEQGRWTPRFDLGKVSCLAHCLIEVSDQNGHKDH